MVTSSPVCACQCVAKAALNVLVELARRVVGDVEQGDLRVGEARRDRQNECKQYVFQMEAFRCFGRKRIFPAPDYPPASSPLVRMARCECAAASITCTKLALMRPLATFVLALLSTAALAAPSAVSTFHSIGLYWSPQGGADSNAARVEFRKHGSADAWRQGLELWFDARNGEYRGSLVELEPGTAYEVKLTLLGCLGDRTGQPSGPARHGGPSTTHVAGRCGYGSVGVLDPARDRGGHKSRRCRCRRAGPKGRGHGLSVYQSIPRTIPSASGSSLIRLR